MLIEITDISHEGLAPYFSLTEKELRREDLFIAESPNVIERALQAGMEPLSLLCEDKHITGDAASIIHNNPELPVYTASRELLASLTG